MVYSFYYLEGPEIKKINKNIFILFLAIMDIANKLTLPDFAGCVLAVKSKRVNAYYKRVNVNFCALAQLGRPTFAKDENNMEWA
ncbi:MAG: hypothetical protein JXD22_15435 [Sedimentisphaerales bacterium]|nr:hypothetical protein [Sedimentisphaerales bacterium]